MGDFDKDGYINEDEREAGLDIWNIKSMPENIDGDLLQDNYEMTT